MSEGESNNSKKNVSSHHPNDSSSKMRSSNNNSSSSNSSSSSRSNDTGISNNMVNVFLRLRPMNKLEAAKRSKDCIELDEDPSKVTVDSPLQGVFQFSFQHVFDEYATQEEVYRQSTLSQIPRKLLLLRPEEGGGGINCTVLAFGQTSTGKSHLIFGPSPTSDLLDLHFRDSADDARISASASASASVSSPPNDNATPLTESQGMMARIVTDLFQTIQNDLPSSTECTIKFSMVELYLERWTDLLRAPRPQSTAAAAAAAAAANDDGNHDNNKNTVWVDGSSQLHGASELCCLHPQDVFRAMLRGMLRRMQSATAQNQDATRSHLLLQLQVEQIDRPAHIAGTSTLRILDLAGSELGRSRSSRQIDSPLAAEGRMVSASLQGLVNYVRAKVAERASKSSTPSAPSSRNKPRMYPSKVYASVSKLTKLLHSSFDGPCFTTTFLTVSPSSYNIGETVNTLKFGEKLQELRLQPRPPPMMQLRNIWTGIPFQDYPAQLQKAEQRVEHLTQFCKLLAVECRIVRKTGKIKQPHAVWDVISRIAKSSMSSETEEDESSDLVISVSRKNLNDDEAQQKEEKVDESTTLQKKLQEAQAAKEKAESQMRDFQSELTALQAEREHLRNENKRLERDLRGTKDELVQLKEAKSDVDRDLRTSRFRESEAIVFLRQFRSFYLRLLKSKATQGNGHVNSIVNEYIHQVPGAADLKDLLDVDQVMIQSGLIEPEEVGQDTNDPNYSPSQIAAQKSESEAENAEERERELMQELKGGRVEPADVTVYRQKLVETPAGRMALQKEKELEADILSLASKCIGLENSVNAEKAMVEALSARQGALGKMKAAQEMNTLKFEFERRSNDLQAIVWKMNELHLVNKAVNEKVENRENHVNYLEESLTALTSKNRQLLTEKQDDEKKLRDENEQLLNQLESTTVKLWQLGEEPPSSRPFRWKVIAPASGEPIDRESHTVERRISLGDIADEGIELLDPPSERKATTSVDSGMQTDDIVLDIDDAAVQTDPLEIEDAGIQTDPLDIEDAEIQTDPLDIEDAEIQTDPVQVFGLDEKTPSPTTESSIATDPTDDTAASDTKSQDMGIQASSDELRSDVGIQTEESQPINDPSDGIKFLSHSKEGVMMIDAGMQTDRQRTKICFEATTQTDGLPDEIALHMSKSNHSGGSLDDTEGDDEATKKISKRPPMPQWKGADRSLSKLDGSVGSAKFDDGSNLHNSSNSLGSFGHLPPMVEESDKQGLGGSMKWNTATQVSSRTRDDRMGASLSVLQVPSQKTTDWRAKLRQKDVPSTPNRARSLGLGTTKPSLTSNSIGGAGKVNNSVASIKTSAKKSEVSKVPEWMTKFKEMGIKADEQGDEGSSTSTPTKSKTVAASPSSKASAGVAAGPSIPAHPPLEKPEWMQKLKSPKNGKRASAITNITSPKAEEPAAAPWAKQLRRSSMGALPFTSTPTGSTMPVVSEDKKPSSEVDLSQETSSGPEWMQRFKQIGMKGEEQIIESTRAEQVVAKDDETEAVAVSKDKQPEWVQKFKQIGQKGTENVI